MTAPQFRETSLADDVGQWQSAIEDNDAVNQTIALDRVMSVVTTVPGWPSAQW